MAYFDSKVYDESTGRLFLVYYALPENVINANGWGVSGETSAVHMPTFVGKPAVIKLKDANYIMDKIQEGNFVHPYAMKGATLQQQLDFQKPYTVGVINSVKLNPLKGYRFDIEITDPKVKAAMISPENMDKFPQWVSPTIATTEDGIAKTWHGLNVTFVDRPAFGFERMKPAGICNGTIEECTVRLKGAGEEEADGANCGFCMGEAALNLIGASTFIPVVNSSQSSEIQNSSEMSQPNSSQGVTGEVTKITKMPGGGNATTTTTDKSNAYTTTTIIKKGSEQNPKQEGDPTEDNFNKTDEVEPGEEEKNAQRKDPDHSDSQRQRTNTPKNYEEALQVIQQQNDRLAQQDERIGQIDKYIKNLEKEKRLTEIRQLIDRRLFKSNDKYEDEVKKVYGWAGITDEEIKKHYDRELELVAKVKGASLETDRFAGMRSVPDYKGASEGKKENSSDNSKIVKSYRLMQSIVGGI